MNSNKVSGLPPILISNLYLNHLLKNLAFFDFIFEKLTTYSLYSFYVSLPIFYNLKFAKTHEIFVSMSISSPSTFLILIILSWHGASQQGKKSSEEPFPPKFAFRRDFCLNVRHLFLIFYHRF